MHSVLIITSSNVPLRHIPGIKREMGKACGAPASTQSSTSTRVTKPQSELHRITATWAWGTLAHRAPIRGLFPNLTSRELLIEFLQVAVDIPAGYGARLRVRGHISAFTGDITQHIMRFRLCVLRWRESHDAFQMPPDYTPLHVVSTVSTPTPLLQTQSSPPRLRTPCETRIRSPEIC